MTRLLARLRYFTRSAWLGLRTSALTSVVAVATIAVTLLLVGAFALVVSNMEALLARFGDALVISAYLEDGLDARQGQSLAERARAVPGVAAVEWVSKDRALERFRAQVGGSSPLLEGLDENPLPASLEITLATASRDPAAAGGVLDAIRALPGVEELGWGHDWVQGYASALALVRGLAVGIGGVLALAALLIVANTIRLALYARRDEVDILLLVGAGRGFVSVPFLLEGLVQGLAGGALALGLLFGLWRLLLPGLADGLRFLLGDAPPAFLGADGALWLVLAGAALGTLGSAAALVQGWRS